MAEDIREKAIEAAIDSFHRFGDDTDESLRAMIGVYEAHLKRQPGADQPEPKNQPVAFPFFSGGWWRKRNEGE
jgi:hypothetical protein